MTTIDPRESTTPRQSDLPALYPEPKSLIRRENEALTRKSISYRNHLRHAAKKSALASYLIMQISTLLAINLKELVIHHTLFGVFFAFLIALIIMAALFVFSRFVGNIFYRQNQSPLLFWWLFSLLFVILLSSVAYGWLGTSIGTSVITSIVFGGIMGLIMHGFIRQAHE